MPPLIYDYPFFTNKATLILHDHTTIGLDEDMIPCLVPNPPGFTPHTARTKQKKWAPQENIFPSVANIWMQPLTSIEAFEQEKQKMTDHLDVRLCAFLRQAIECYDTPKVYAIGVVEDQLASSTAGHQSAHVGTLPCLIAYNRADYEAWFSGRSTIRPQAEVHQKYSDSYLINNMCESLLRSVNEVDIKIDNLLRPSALSLINQLAKKECDPLQAFRSFFASLYQAIADTFQQESNPIHQHILSAYAHHLSGLCEHSDLEMLKLLFGIQLNPQDPYTEQLKVLVCLPRIKALKTTSLCQSQIVAHIEATRVRLLGGHRYNKFDKLFKARVIMRAALYSERMRLLFVRHFCTNCDQAAYIWQYEDRCNPARRYLTTPASTQAIDHMILDIDNFAFNLGQRLSVIRGEFLRDVRTSRNLSQEKLADDINALFPQAGLTQQKISKIETGHSRMSDELVTQVCTYFKVDSTLFMADIAPYALPI